MKKIQEGKVIFKANLSGKDKGPGKIKGVFYNPSMKLSRDLHVEFAKQFDFKGTMLDGMAASGIRGMRLMLESNIRVEFCDWIRDERKFDGSAALKNQIKTDIQDARNYFELNPRDE